MKKLIKKWCLAGHACWTESARWKHRATLWLRHWKQHSFFLLFVFSGRWPTALVFYPPLHHFPDQSPAILQSQDIRRPFFPERIFYPSFLELLKKVKWREVVSRWWEDEGGEPTSWLMQQCFVRSIHLYYWPRFSGHFLGYIFQPDAPDPWLTGLAFCINTSQRKEASDAYGLRLAVVRGRHETLTWIFYLMTSVKIFSYTAWADREDLFKMKVWRVRFITGQCYFAYIPGLRKMDLKTTDTMKLFCKAYHVKSGAYLEPGVWLFVTVQSCH